MTSVIIYEVLELSAIVRNLLFVRVKVFSNREMWACRSRGIVSSLLRLSLIHPVNNNCNWPERGDEISNEVLQFFFRVPFLQMTRGAGDLCSDELWCKE